MRKTMVLSFLAMSIFGFCQDRDDSTSSKSFDMRSSLLVSVNTLAGLNGGALLNYHQPLFKSVKLNGVFGLILSTGIWYDGVDLGPLFALRTSYLGGVKEHHVEATLGGGIVSLPDLSNSDEKEIYGGPFISVGYRNQSPERKFTYRVGLGLPEGIYVGFGYLL